MGKTSSRTGLRRHGAGWQAYVSVAGAGRLFESFPLETSEATMQAWRKHARARLQLVATARPASHAGGGTFASDARRYLRTVTALPTYRDRVREIELWIAEFGEVRREAITPAMIRAVRDRWLTVGPKRVYSRDADGRYRWHDRTVPLAASTVNHRLRALANLYTVLDGRHAANPVREVPEADEPDPLPRGLPSDVIERILDAMPDISRGSRRGKRIRGSKTRARLRVMAYTGLSQGELMRVTPADIDLAAGTLLVRGRLKGRGSRPSLRPLLPEAVAALKAFDRLGCYGRFSRDAMRESFTRACRKLGLTGLRPYDMRHSFATALYKGTTDLQATQMLMGHADPRTTLRYALSAVPVALRAAIERVRRTPGSYASATKGRQR